MADPDDPHTDEEILEVLDDLIDEKDPPPRRKQR